MQKLHRLCAALALLGALASFVPDAAAQGCGPANPNCIVPTAPLGTSNNQAASTAFVQQNGGYTGLSGDCTATSLGVITCLKTNGTPFGTMATQNAGAVAITGGTITGMPNPIVGSDVANKTYVDSLAGGIIVLASSGLATAAVLPNSPTYANGASGVGATLTAGSNTTLTVDGTAAPLNTVVLVKNQASAFQNGIYTVTQAGSGAAPWILARATYFDQAAEMKAGSYTLITGGTVNAGSAWTLQTAVTTVGTDPLNWLQFSQGASSVASGGAVIASRAAAALLNLSAFTTVTAQGYALPGDGGSATFQKISAGTPFIDSFITTFTITGGSGFTNGGPYYGVIWSNAGKFAIGTATVSGGAVTAVNIANTPSASCKVGDVYTFAGSAAQVGGAAGGMPAGGTGASITVTGCSTPLASFTDSAANKWQFVPDVWPNVKQFGCIGDWDGTDAGATDNFNCVQAAYWFASAKSATSYDAGGNWGNRVLFPRGSYKVCGTGTQSLIVPHGAQSWGAGGTASELRFCDSFSGTTVLAELGDPNWHFACFQASFWHMAIASQGAGTAFGIHSNCGQDYAGVYFTYLFLNGNSRRGCIHYEAGFGGASWFGIHSASCNAISNGPQIQIGNTVASGLNLGNTNVSVRDIVMGGPSSGPNLQTGPGIQVYGGNGSYVNVHGEAMPTVVQLDVAATPNNEMQWLQNINGGGGPIACTGVVTLTANNNPGNAAFSQFPSRGSCAHNITNGQSGGAHFDGVISKPISCVSGACS